MNYTNRPVLLSLAICLVSILALGQFSNSTPPSPSTSIQNPSFPRTGMTAQQLQDALKEIEQLQLMPRDRILTIEIYNPDQIVIRTGIQRGPRSGRGTQHLFKRENGSWLKISEVEWAS